MFQVKLGLIKRRVTPENPLHSKILTILWFHLILKGDIYGTFWIYPETLEVYDAGNYHEIYF